MSSSWCNSSYVLVFINSFAARVGGDLCQVWSQTSCHVKVSCVCSIACECLLNCSVLSHRWHVFEVALNR